MGRRWYYAKSGGRHGPVSDSELKALAGRGELQPDDLVWTDGLAEWRPARRVNGLFPSAPAEPPPLTAAPLPGTATARRVVARPVEEPQDLPEDDEDEYVRPRVKRGRPTNDLWAWLLVAVPVVGAVIELIVGRPLLLLFFVSNTIFALADVRALKATKHPAPSGWWGVLLVPVYLWQRGTLLRRPRLHFGLWVGSFVVSLALTLSLDRSGVEDTARPLVTQIVREQLGGTAKCVRVRVTEDVGGGYYKGVATLDNGNDLRILIETRGNMVYVTIPR